MFSPFSGKIKNSFSSHSVLFEPKVSHPKVESLCLIFQKSMLFFCGSGGHVFTSMEDQMIWFLRFFYAGPSYRNPRKVLKKGCPFLFFPIILLLSGALAENPVSAEEGSFHRRDKIPLAVLGDSDSHAYHDNLRLPLPLRGGKYRSVTYQWTEILHRLREEQLDFGAWGVWGDRWKVAALKRLFGLGGRAPKKEDYEYNLAISGALCENLITGTPAQIPPLLQILNQNPAHWDRGLIVVRIGINSLEKPEHLEEYARLGLNPHSRARINAGVHYIAEAVRMIREKHKRVRIVLVGLFEEPNSVPLVKHWQSKEETARIREVLDFFDGRLQGLASSDPNIIFVDDRGWWKEYWGNRDEEGKPHFRSVSLGGKVAIAHTQGNHPQNMVLEDGHAGTVTNGLFARHMVRRINNAFGLGLSPLLDSEIADLADPSREIWNGSSKKGNLYPHDSFVPGFHPHFLERPALVVENSSQRFQWAGHPLHRSRLCHR